jgi:predicted transcriptional regulator of viral defense system
MRPGLEGITASQHGIFARWQAIGCGITPREFDRLSRRGGPWIRVRYGVYTTREIWNSLDRRQRLILRDRAAALVCDDDAVLSHTSAARLLDLPLYGVEDEQLSHVTRRSAHQAGRTQADVQHHLGVLDAEETCVIGGVRVTSLERTVLDLARDHGYLTGLVAADAALRAGASRPVLEGLANRLTTEPGRPRVHAVIEAADGGAETPIETLGRVTLLKMGIDDLELQHVVRFSGGGHAECDIYSKELHHVFECDGRIKYTEQFDRFGNLITPDEVVWLEKGREDRVRGEGLGFSRLTWADVQPDSFERTSSRLWREIGQQGGRHSRTPPPGA